MVSTYPFTTLPESLWNAKSFISQLPKETELSTSNQKVLETGNKFQTQEKAVLFFFFQSI